MYFRRSNRLRWFKRLLVIIVWVIWAFVGTGFIAAWILYGK